jgi:cellulose synthase/poly-beta-1,6-N-acetylglucosamine synthase-like glycosyltransferase
MPSYAGHLAFLGDLSFSIAAVMLFAIGLSTWVWMLHAWSTPRTHRRTGGNLQAHLGEPCFSFSLIVPARHEEGVLASTLERMANVNHPWFEIIVVVGDDDTPTRDIAYAAAARHPGLITVGVDSSSPKSKPKALNTALRLCRNEIVGIFDAEDEVNENLLRQADAVFERTAAHVVQGGVQLVTLRNSWFSVRNCLEYFFWFRSRLHAHAEDGFAPLGGNTVFFRRDRLLEIGGWDEECLAEDCEIGIRMSSKGARIAVWYDPSTATREETPRTVQSFIKQRTRWDQGYIQVLRNRHWKALPTRRQRALAQYVLVFPIIQAAMGLLLPMAVVIVVFGQLPLLLTLMAIAPLLMMIGILATEAIGLTELSQAFSLRARPIDYLMLVITLIPYQLLLAVAAIRALWREMLGNRGWEKTDHEGIHRVPVSVPSGKDG